MSEPKSNAALYSPLTAGDEAKATDDVYIINPDDMLYKLSRYNHEYI